MHQIQTDTATKKPRIFRRLLIGVALMLVVLVGATFVFLEFYTPPLPEHHGKLNTELFLGDGERQPLVVGFGGGEGGNAWAGDYWKETRDRFISEGYAFLAIGYFGMDGTPQNLDRISLDAIHDEVVKTATSDPRIDGNRIAVVGGSKGGELVLNLASRYEDIHAVVAIVPGHVSFPALTPTANTSSWSFKGEEVPYVPAPYSTILAMMRGDIYRFFELTLDQSKSHPDAVIEVERINGSVLLISASNDEMWPSKLMCEKIEERLQEKGFSHDVHHIRVEGSHEDATKRFDEVIAFISEELSS